MKDKLKELTVDEKASLTSGQNMWQTKGVDRLGIPPIWMTDGPHGLRKQETNGDSMGIGESKPAVSFPSESTTACSFDRKLLEEIGSEHGKECNAESVHLLLGPGINIKRSPLCGRNFEYFSEDPYLTGELGTAYVRGLQDEGVGSCVKHYLLNNQETKRMTSSSEADERTAREIYMSAFENVVKNAKPWAVMCSYNKINGTYASENRTYMTDVLRGEWGFDGCVVSDWGATHSRAKAVAAGCDLTMPGSPDTDSDVANPVKSGMMTETLLDTAAQNVLGLIEKGLKQKKGGQFDYARGHALARKAAAESAVLLKNDEGLLPLAPTQKIAFIGEFATSPRCQGGGSSYVNTHNVVSALAAVKDIADVTYSKGYSGAVPDEKLILDAVKIAKKVDVAVLFVGLTEEMETEGADRTHMRLPDSHNALIAAVAKVQKNTVVVLSNGSAVEMPWADDAKAILETYLGGEATGEATVDLLFGKANPSGRLAESFPYRLEDNPSYLHYLGTGNKVEYREGVYVGYRYYESAKQAVRYPFGYGLSYTEFTYSNLKVSADKIAEGENITVSVNVANVGKCAGKEVVQLYIGVEQSDVLRPIRELRGFDKIELKSGEKKTVTFELDSRAFAYWNDEAHAFCLADGIMSVQICKNAHDVILSAPINVTGSYVKKEIGMTSLVGELAATRLGKQFLDKSADELLDGIKKTGMADGLGVEISRENLPDILSKLHNQTVETLSTFLPNISAGIWGTIFGMINSDEQ